ncbi:MAG: PAS domain S-box protein, partial [Proteobacteria bacterium]|nr:PAS domain S-box protein [Pseudomonadota bacterium]
MSTILVPALISVTIMSLLVAALYFHLYLVNKDRLLKLWSAAWGLYSLRFIVLTLMVLHILPPWMVVIQEAATLFSALLCMTGANALANRSTPSWWRYGAGAALCWVVLTQFLHLPFFWSDLPVSAFTGLLFALSGAIILRQVQIPGVGRAVSSYALILWGIHRADYTFLRPVAWFAPWGFLLASVLFLAAAIGILLLYYDKMRAELLKEIQDRNLVQKTLAESEDKYRMLFENMTPGVFYQSVDGVLTDCNTSALEMLGLTRDQFIGKTFLDPQWKVIKEDGTELSGDEHPSMVALNIGKSVHDEVIGVFNPHKKEYTWLVVNAIPQFKTGVDKPYQAFVTLHDITERKKMEEQLHQAQKMESIGRLAGGVAHDFNNMLSIILGNTELILEDLDPSNPVIGSLHEIQKAAERSTNLTRQLLAFARKQTISPKVIDLNKTIEGMLKMLRRLIGENIDLTWLPKINLWAIKLDPSQVDQILANLCVNARDAIKDVGKITIETDNVSFDNDYCIEHDGFIPGDYVMTAISDNGCGMSKEILF